MPYYILVELEDGKTIRESQEYDTINQLLVERMPEILEDYTKRYGELDSEAIESIYEMLAYPNELGPALIYDNTSNNCKDEDKLKMYPDARKIYIVKI